MVRSNDARILKTLRQKVAKALKGECATYFYYIRVCCLLFGGKCYEEEYSQCDTVQEQSPARNKMMGFNNLMAWHNVNHDLKIFLIGCVMSSNWYSTKANDLDPQSILYVWRCIGTLKIRQLFVAILTWTCWGHVLRNHRACKHIS